jgi:hypothetical protein
LEKDANEQPVSRHIMFSNVEIVTDGKYVEPENLRLTPGKERLMNGNLYKIRASVAGYVNNISTENKSETLSNDDQKELPIKPNENHLVEANVSKTKYEVLDDLSGETIRVEYKSLMKKSKPIHAWAITIHKFQGSEADSVVYGLSGSHVESWRHVYTAVTRGKKNVTIVGSFNELQQAVKKLPVQKQTTLREKIQNMLNSSETPSKILGSQMEKQLDLTSSTVSPLKRNGESSGNQPSQKLIKKLF